MECWDRAEQEDGRQETMMIDGWWLHEDGVGGAGGRWLGGVAGRRGWRAVEGWP